MDLEPMLNVCGESCTWNVIIEYVQYTPSLCTDIQIYSLQSVL